MTSRDDALKAAAEALHLVNCRVPGCHRGGDGWLASAEAAVAAAAPILLAEAQREAERLRGIIERVAWSTARMVGAISTETIEPLPEDYDLENLHAQLQTRIGIERLEFAREIEQLRQALASERDAASVVAAPILLAVERARIAAAIDQAWAEKKDSAAARDYPEYHEGYLDGLEHAQRIAAREAALGIAETAPEEGS